MHSLSASFRGRLRRAHKLSQAPAKSQATVADDALGQIATLQGGATVTRAKAAAAALKISDAVSGQQSRVQHCARHGRFVASLVAKTGDMTITTPTSTLGIRGTTGVVDVPDSAAPGGAGEAKIRLYPDADGRVGRIDVFSRQGERLGALTQGASAFAIRPGAGGRFAAVPFQIPPQEAARVTPCRAPDDLATPATARTKSAAAEPATEPAAEPAAAESAWAAGRSAAAGFEIPSRRATRPRRGAAAVCRRG